MLLSRGLKEGSLGTRALKFTVWIPEPDFFNWLEPWSSFACGTGAQIQFLWGPDPRVLKFDHKSTQFPLVLLTDINKRDPQVAQALIVCKCLSLYCYVIWGICILEWVIRNIPNRPGETWFVFRFQLSLYQNSIFHQGGRKFTKSIHKYIQASVSLDPFALDRPLFMTKPELTLICVACTRTGGRGKKKQESRNRSLSCLYHAG